MSTPTTQDRLDVGRLDDLAHEVRSAVVRAVRASDLDAKIRWWKSYRAARREALTLLHDTSEPQGAAATFRPGDDDTPDR